ncbi:hypothetical protein BJX68DRAFT_237398 [Aspergillus pseudodeflectus]|uniref:Secreted protein n=1 Tax=Aspergillus pseudodeflectus TaxID=176178 RepID=A0ABR4KCW4_9EURO
MPGADLICLAVLRSISILLLAGSSLGLKPNSLIICSSFCFERRYYCLPHLSEASCKFHKSHTSGVKHRFTLISSAWLISLF